MTAKGRTPTSSRSGRRVHLTNAVIEFRQRGDSHRHTGKLHIHTNNRFGNSSSFWRSSCGKIESYNSILIPTRTQDVEDICSACIKATSAAWFEYVEPRAVPQSLPFDSFFEVTNKAPLPN